MPRVEMSLPGSLMVQALHALQDLYPVVSEHQPEAPRDPRERLRQAYPWLFRLVRTPPVWHAELAQAQQRGTLLDLLAVGGPYAKLLERSARQEYVIDLDYLRGYPVRPGLARLGCRIRYEDRGRTVSVRAIEYEGKFVRPGDTLWPMAERVALCSLSTHTTVWRHGMQYHVGGVAPFAVATHQLPPDHPLRRLLAPHMADTLSTNYHTHLTLRRNGFDVTGFSFSYDTILRYYDDGARYFDIRRLDPRQDAGAREIGADLEYPHQPQAERYFDLFSAYTTEYLSRYYPDEASVAQDAAVRAWFDTLNRHVMRGLSGYAPALTRESLARLCALYMYTVSVEHEDNTMWNYAMFLPATVRDDGRGESVGQVQAVVNFELLISSATNRLMNDASHVALDPQGAAVMRGFQSRLAQLQEQMEHEPARYWRILPRDLEASVSA
jgi:arachidonate 15-lipoxygenase